jgi:hypothetical protein
VSPFEAPETKLGRKETGLLRFSVPLARFFIHGLLFARCQWRRSGGGLHDWCRIIENLTPVARVRWIDALAIDGFLDALGFCANCRDLPVPLRYLGHSIICRQGPWIPNQHVTCMRLTFLPRDSLNERMASGVGSTMTRQPFFSKYALASGERLTFPC